MLESGGWALGSFPIPRHHAGARPPTHLGEGAPMAAKSDEVRRPASTLRLNRRIPAHLRHARPASALRQSPAGGRRPHSG